MDFVWDHPSVPASAFWLESSASSTSSSSSSSSFSGRERRSYSFSSVARFGDRSSSSSRRGREGFVASRLAGRVLLAVLTCIIAIVGSFVGTITGALIGLATESGMFRGAGIGAISGAVFSIEAVEYSRAVWRSDGYGIWSVLFLIDIIVSLLKGTLVREKVGPAMQSAVRSQMSAVDAPFSEEVDIFETGGTCGMSSDSVDRIPKLLITEENNADTSGEKICCSVCLQDFQSGETVRSLPQCQHMFHLPCIDSWLIRHGSCPLCRRDF